MILLVINEKRTEDEGRIICDVFSGDLSITKTGYVSGKTQKIVREDEEFKSSMSKFKYSVIDIGVITLDNKSFAKTIESEKILVGYNNNRKVYIISENSNIKIKNVSLEKNKLFITNKKDVVKVDEKFHIIVCSGNTIFVQKNSVWILDSTIDKKVLKQVIFSKRPKSEITKGELFYSSNELTKFEICNDTRIMVELSINKKKYCAAPVVLYNGEEAKKIDDQTVWQDGISYYQDIILENKIKCFFERYEMISPDVYVIPNKAVYKSIKAMIDSGFEVFYDKKRTYIDDSAFDNVHIENSIDWFEVNGSVEFDDESIEIAELIGISTPFVGTDNKMVIVPENIMSLLEMTDDQGHIEKNPQNYMDVLELAENHFDKSKLGELFYDDLPLKVPEMLIETLYDYQFDGVVWLKSLAMRGYGGCLADDMGLGKTLQIITFLSDEDVSNTIGKTIIIVPKTLLGNWISEFEKYKIKDKKVSLYYGANRILAPEADIYITTYGVVTSDYEILSAFKIDMVILDEAQKVKNAASKTRRIIKHFSEGKLLFAATGTPFENNLAELWSIMDLTNPNMLGSLKEFSYKYIYENNEDCVVKLSEKISPFLLRRTKEEVLKQLPKKIQENIVCLMDEKQQRLYNAMLIKLKKDLKKIKEPGTQKLHMLNGLTYLREICCHPKLINDAKYQKCNESIKLDVVMDLIDKAIQKKEKIVVFSQFTRFLNIIEETLISNDIKYCYIDGQTSDRENEIKQFEDANRYVFLISLKAGGFGINLTNAKKMVICDPWWNPAVERQAEDRIYRIGQTENVTVYRLIAKNTIEERIQILKEQKDELGNLVFEGLKDISELEMNKIQKLFD